MLKDLQNLVTELNTTNSTNEKKTILAKYPQCKEILIWVYSPFKIFGVTSKNCKKFKDLKLDIAGNVSIIDLLHKLSTRDITGHDAIGAINSFIEYNLEYKELIYNIIDKNLKTRTDAKLINSIWPDLIPSFDVALAKSFDKVTKKPDFDKEIWYASRKLDGVRCLIIKEHGVAKAYSRTGKDFNTLNKVLNAIEALPGDNMVFDGEICLINNGVEDFQGVMKEIRKKDHTIENPKYKLFDIIPLTDFHAKKSDLVLRDRLEVLEELFYNYTGDTLSVLKQQHILDQSMLDACVEEAASEGWEGIMLRKSIGYEGKRSNNLLKLKKFHDAEYVVTGIETGLFRITDKATGLEAGITTLTRVNIEHKGSIVGVGSGFSLDQRREFFENPDLIIGKTITVAYFEETTNQNGGVSLRFPTFKCLHGDKRTV